ncbi:MAG: hypothetical protein Rsou_1782 [Candidatus Ruthia sp. Asou_11_S2]|nr:hypothetical protein [Candidatus Ruthia sp. Asou_11_S2]
MLYFILYLMFVKGLTSLYAKLKTIEISIKYAKSRKPDDIIFLIF